MTTKEAHEVLRTYNEWRRGAEIPQPEPKEIGEAIDTAISALETMEVRSGKWETLAGLVSYCTHCGQPAHHKSNYCQSCCAKMDKETEAKQ